MSSNLVTVEAALGLSGQGHWLFAATGTLMSDSQIAIVLPVQDGTLDPSGNLSVQLLASDNYSAGELLWNCFAQFQGFAAIHVSGFEVNFALGATQNLWTILETAGWTPS